MADLLRALRPHHWVKNLLVFLPMVAALLAGSLTAQPRAIVEYAYEDSGAGINAGAIPAPGAAALLGVAGLMGSRRRRSA